MSCFYVEDSLYMFYFEACLFFTKWFTNIWETSTVSVKGEALTLQGAIAKPLLYPSAVRPLSYKQCVLFNNSHWQASTVSVCQGWGPRLTRSHWKVPTVFVYQGCDPHLSKSHWQAPTVSVYQGWGLHITINHWQAPQCLFISSETLILQAVWSV